MLEDFKDKEALKKNSANAEENFEEKFKYYDPLAVDLLRKMLTFDPAKRITINEALAHSYLSALHFEDDEPTTEVVSAFDFDFEIYDLKKEDYKDLLYAEVMLYHSEELLQKYIENKEKYPSGMLASKYGAEPFFHKK